MLLLQLFMCQIPNNCFFNWIDTEHSTTHFVHCSSVLKEDLNAINSEIINNSQIL